MTRKTLARITPAIGGLAAILLSGGCTSGSNPLGRDALIRNNPTPELSTLDLRDVDQANRRAIAVNEDFRLLAEDWDRFWFINRASRLTLYPMR